MNQLGLLFRAKSLHAQAEPLYRRALAIDEKSYGPDHPDVATDLNNLAGLLRATNRLAEAEPLYRRAIGILHRFERENGYRRPNYDGVEANFAALLVGLGKKG
jgi:tetratricopeptide (TPR) repeat protein